MSQQIERRDRFAVAAPTFWDIFFSADFQHRMYTEALACTGVEILAQDGSPSDGLQRTLRFTQPLDAPAVVKKLFGDATTMEETGRFDAATGRRRFSMRPDRLGDRVLIQGETWLEPTAEGVERVCKLDVNVSMFGVGSIVERVIASSSEKSYARQADFVNIYIRERGLR